MTKRTAKLILGVLCLGCAFGAIALSIAWATPSVGVTRTTISGPVTYDDIDVWSHTDTQRVRLQTEGFSDVYVIKVTIAPGGQTGWHAHPGPAFVSVNSGMATEYSGDDPNCTPVVHLAGTGFMETTGHVHNVWNRGSVPVELVALYILPVGAPLRIDVPNPGNCPF
jgi:hypothetical protein